MPEFPCFVWRPDLYTVSLPYDLYSISVYFLPLINWYATRQSSCPIFLDHLFILSMPPFATISKLVSLASIYFEIRMIMWSKYVFAVNVLVEFGILQHRKPYFWWECVHKNHVTSGYPWIPLCKIFNSNLGSKIVYYDAWLGIEGNGRFIWLYLK